MAEPDFIDNLLKDEDLPDLEPSGALKKIELTPSAEILEKTNAQIGVSEVLVTPQVPSAEPEPEGAEKRIFTRVDVTQQNLELKFTNDLQFAKQYIENISLGGLFVKTLKKHEMGEIVPIEFSIPAPNAPKLFHLRGKVCRITSDGVGLEFTNLSLEARQELEDFVRTILPKGSNIQSKAKAASIERLEKARDEKSKLDQRLRRLAINTVIIGLLVSLNFFLYQNMKMQDELNAAHTRLERIQIGNRSVERSDIRGISRNSEGTFIVYLNNGEQIKASRIQLEDHLPYDLRVDLKVLTSMPHPKPKRISKTSRVSRLVR